MHSHLHLLRNTKVIASKDTHPLKMELDSKLRENLATQQQQPFFVPENYMKPYMKDHNEFPFETTPPNSKNTFLQDFHYVDQFHENVSSSNPMFGGQTACYVDSFDNNAIPYGCSSTNLDFYECKPYVDNGGHGQVMDNFQSGGYLNMTHRNSFDMMGSDRYQMNLDFQELKPVKFVVPDEVSCVSTAGNGYYKKVGMNNKNNKALASTRRTWKCRKKNNVVKGQWTIEEDRLLIQLVEKFGVRKWSHIAQVLPGRIGKQCRERWHNHLRPDIKKDTWSEEEDKVLIQAHVEIGNKWAEIAKRLPGRTENSIKNHWNATKRRQFSKRKCRSKYPRGSLLQDYIKSLNLDSSTSRYQQKASSATDTTMNAPNQQPQELDFCSSDRLVPNYDDFSEVPDFDFDEKLFQETCSIDSLLDEIPCATVVDEKDPEMEEQVQMPPLLEFEVKKELDLVEMISQSNL